MMYAQKGTALARKCYEETDLVARVEASSPHALVGLLYDQLIEALDVMVALLAQGHTIQNTRHSQRAQSILIALQTGLDFDRGGAVAQALANVYRNLSAMLGRAIVEGNLPLLRELQSSVAEISTSWKSIAA